MPVKLIDRVLGVFQTIKWLVTGVSWPVRWFGRLFAPPQIATIGITSRTPEATTTEVEDARTPRVYRVTYDPRAERRAERLNQELQDTVELAWDLYEWRLQLDEGAD